MHSPNYSINLHFTVCEDVRFNQLYTYVLQQCPLGRPKCYRYYLSSNLRGGILSLHRDPDSLKLLAAKLSGFEIPRDLHLKFFFVLTEKGWEVSEYFSVTIFGCDKSMVNRSTSNTHSAMASSERFFSSHSMLSSCKPFFKEQKILLSPFIMDYPQIGRWSNRFLLSIPLQ